MSLSPARADRHLIHAAGLEQPENPGGWAVIFSFIQHKYLFFEHIYSRIYLIASLFLFICEHNSVKNKHTPAIAAGANTHKKKR
jgi:hypothetical protein